MIKFAVAALWISIVTTAAMLFSFKWSQQPAEAAVAEAEADAFKGLDYVKTGVLSVPMFHEGKVYGYFLARLVFTAEAKRLAELKLPAEAIITDSLYTHLYANPNIDFTSRDRFDVEQFREDIRVAVNAKLGEEMVREILVEQIDFLPKDEVGTTRLPKTKPTPPAAKEAPDPHASGH